MRFNPAHMTAYAIAAITVVAPLVACSARPDGPVVVSSVPTTTEDKPFGWNDYTKIVTGTPTPAPVKTAERWEDLMLPPTSARQRER